MQLKSFYRISILFSEAVAEGSLKAGKAMRIAIVGTVVAGAAISASGEGPRRRTERQAINPFVAGARGAVRSDEERSQLLIRDSDSSAAQGRSGLGGGWLP